MIPIHHLEGRMDMDTGKIEHLKMIQDVIKRMANKSKTTCSPFFVQTAKDSYLSKLGFSA